MVGNSFTVVGFGGDCEWVLLCCESDWVGYCVMKYGDGILVYVRLTCVFLRIQHYIARALRFRHHTSSQEFLFVF